MTHPSSYNANHHAAKAYDKALTDKIFDSGIHCSLCIKAYNAGWKKKGNN